MATGIEEAWDFERTPLSSPRVRVGWFVRFEPDEVAAWVGAHRVESRRTV
jgi:hypothetical protein